MSRITKEEIEKTKCGRFLLSDENIYLSIYSLNSYVFEYNLLNTEDRILYHRLQDKFDARLINRVITRVENWFRHPVAAHIQQICKSKKYFIKFYTHKPT